MTDAVALERAVRAWVAAGSGLARERVIPGNDPHPRQGWPYATVTLVSDLVDGSAWTRYVKDGNSIESTTMVSTEIEFSVQWFAESQDAKNLARKFLVYVKSPTGLDEAGRRGLTFYRHGALRDLSADVDKRLQTRLQVDVTLGVVWSDTRDVGIAETIGIHVNRELIPDNPHGELGFRADVPSQKQMEKA